MKAQAKQLTVSRDRDLAKLAMATAAGDDAAEKMLRDLLLERYPLQNHEFGTFMRVGLPYMVRTVSDYFTGVVLAQTASEILLGSAGWVPDMGRFTDALSANDQEQAFNEVEPVPDPAEWVVCRQSVVSYGVLPWQPPRNQK